MEKEFGEAHPKHVASMLRSDAAAWIGAITLWLYLGAILTTRGYLSVFGASPEWFDLTVFQLTSFSMFPLLGAAVAATGYSVFWTSRGWGPEAIFGYLAWALVTTLTSGFIFFSSNRYNFRPDSWWGRDGLVAMLAFSLIGPLVFHFLTARRRRRSLSEIDDREGKLKSIETEIAEMGEEHERAIAQVGPVAGNDPALREKLDSLAATSRANLLAQHQRLGEIRAVDARLRSDLERATPEEMWLAIGFGALLTLSSCVSMGQAWALLVTSDPPRAVNVAAGVTEEILLTDGERSLARKIVKANEEIVYLAGDREWVVRMRDGSIPAPAARPSPATIPAISSVPGRAYLADQKTNGEQNKP